MNFKIEISRDLIGECIQNAYVSYWFEFDRVQSPYGYEYDENVSYDTWIQKVLQSDEAIVWCLEHEEYNKTTMRTFHREDIQDALQIMSKTHPEYLGNIIKGDTYDIEGDVLLQLAIFGQVKYG